MFEMQCKQSGHFLTLPKPTGKQKNDNNNYCNQWNRDQIWLYCTILVTEVAKDKPKDLASLTGMCCKE